MKALRVILIITLTVLAGLLGFISYKLYIRVGEYNNIDATWELWADLSSEASHNAYLYLSDSGYKDIAEADLANQMQDIKVPVIMSFDFQDSKSGTYSVEVDEEDYDRINGEAYSILEKCVRDIIVERLKASDLNPKEEASEDDIISEALGCDLHTFIMEHGPELLPSYDSLCEAYNDSGSFATSDGTTYATSDVTGHKILLSRIKDNLIVQVRDSEDEKVYVYSQVNSSDSADDTAF